MKNKAPVIHTSNMWKIELRQEEVKTRPIIQNNTLMCK
jgi:hypothetical protein